MQTQRGQQQYAWNSRKGISQLQSRFYVPMIAQRISQVSNLDRLLDKHSSEHAGARRSANPMEKTALQVSKVAVLKVVRSFSARSAGGPDGIRPQHLLEVVQSQEMGTHLLASLTVFVNSLLDGRCYKEIMQILFGGCFLAMDKKAVGIRPLRWVMCGGDLQQSAPVHMSSIESRADYFNPLQVRVSATCGCEVTIHAIRRFISTMPTDNNIIKLDFNSSYMDYMLERISEVIPKLYKSCYPAYNYHSHLQFCEFCLTSKERSQQADQKKKAF